MAELTYGKAIICLLFAKKTNLHPTAKELFEFDAELEKDYSALAQEWMKHFGLDNTDRVNESLVLGCRADMPGDNPEMQIRHACNYVLTVNNVLEAAKKDAKTNLVEAVAPLSKKLGPSKPKKKG